MPNQILIDLINNRLEDLGISARKASLSVGTNPDLLRKILDGTVSYPRGHSIALIARALQLPKEKLLEACGEGPIDPRLAAHAAVPSARITAEIPVMGTAAGSVIERNFEGFALGGPVDYVSRPPALSQARDVYALYVTGESMTPMYQPGSLVFVHPHRPVQVGQPVIVQTRTWNDDPGQAYIKLLERRSGERLVLRQLNPPATIEIPIAHVTSLHRVLTVNELFGV